jgi:hypothetical protein
MKSILVPASLVLMLSAVVRSEATDPERARHAMAVLQDATRTELERAEASQVLLSLSPAQLKFIESELIRIVQNEAVYEKAITDRPETLSAPAMQLYAIASDLMGRLVPDPGSIPALVEMLRRSRLGRFQAAVALGNLGAGARSAVPALANMLHSDEPDQVEVATFVLARIAPDRAAEAAVPALIEVVETKSGWVGGFNGAVALLKLRREEERSRALIRGVSLHLELPLLESPQPLHRLHLCEALSFYGPPQRDLLDLLRKRAAEDSDPRVRDAAVVALRRAGADVRLLRTADKGPKALPSVPPELRAAANALLESRPSLTLLGGTAAGNTAQIDYFSGKPAAYEAGTMTMKRSGGRWIVGSTTYYDATDQPAINEFKPAGQDERAALDALQAIAAAQLEHWNRSTPKSYADSFGALMAGGAQAPASALRAAEKHGYVMTMAGGSRSGSVVLAWYAEAHPAHYKRARSFYVDERGITLISDTGGKPLLLALPER